jgi:pimeloyl-ACP methyl ester carboxylesterase
MPSAPKVSVPAENSTIVRTGFMSGLFRVLDRVSPALGAALADRLFFTPPPPRNSGGLRALRKARRFQVRSGVHTLSAWRWGRGPAVVFLHGWGGRAAQWTSFVGPLVSRGFSVVAFDAPGHGSSGRTLSSAVDFARALERVTAHLGGAHAVVAHSLGSAAAVLALRRGLTCRRLVFLGPASDPPAWVRIFADRLGLSPRLRERMRQRSERRIGVPWSELEVMRHAPAGTASLLVVHDRDDSEVAWSDGAAIASAWPGARLLTTTGLGHNRILRDAAVVAAVADFLAEDEALRCPSCGAAAASSFCGVCIERELFDPDLRRPVLERNA